MICHATKSDKPDLPRSSSSAPPFINRGATKTDSLSRRRGRMYTGATTTAALTTTKQQQAAAANANAHPFSENSRFQRPVRLRPFCALLSLAASAQRRRQLVCVQYFHPIYSSFCSACASTSAATAAAVWRASGITDVAGTDTNFFWSSITRAWEKRGGETAGCGLGGN